MQKHIDKLDNFVNSNKNELNLDWRGITMSHLPTILKFLNDNPNITTLKLLGNDVGVDGAYALATNTTLRTLDLARNHLSDGGASAIAMNTTLTTLILTYNQITVIGARALAANTTLRTLDLNRNYLGEQGAKVMATNTTLTSLNVVSNYISIEGARAFTVALEHNKSLLKLTHDFDADNATKIRKKLTRNQVMPWLTTIRNARLMSQAQRSVDCPLGKLPIELAGFINDFSVGKNHFSFFIQQYEKRPSAGDLKLALRLAKNWNKQINVVSL